MKTIFLLYLIMLCISLNMQASVGEDVTQTVRGRIVDADSRIPIIGANVVVMDVEPVIGTVTDVNGYFALKQVPVGRIDLKISYLGYEHKFLSNLLLGSGRELFLEIEMQESLVELDEVVVSQKQHKSDALNEMALLSSRAFSVEETQRYAGSLNDPARMVSSFAGVTGDPHGNNSIVVRGNSPRGIQWRLEGVEIPNPNHFADEGMTGGPINALNSDMLGNSDFFTGAFAPEYGNAFSGVFDMRMRTGNVNKHEYSFGLGVLGTDVTMEGPVRLGKNASYLVNYRYSSLAILDEANIVDFQGIPKYQDLSLKVVMPTEKLGSFTLFGLGGLSSIQQSYENNDADITSQDVYNSQLGVLGLNHTYFFNDKIYLKSNFTFSGNGSDYTEEEPFENTDGFRLVYNDDLNKLRYKASTDLNVKFNAQHRLLIGTEYTLEEYDFFEEYFDDQQNRMETGINHSGTAQTWQSFVSWKYRMSPKVTMVSGVHGLYFDLNDELSIEPRIGLQWKVSPRHTIHGGYGLHAKPEPIPIYHMIVTHEDGSETIPNQDLKLAKAQHYVLGYDYKISKNMVAKVELYYQDLYNIGVGTGPDSLFSVLNDEYGYVDIPLVSEGTGTNYGLEFTLERYFANNYYFLLTGSLYDSKFTNIKGNQYNTTFNGNYAGNFLIGKEFQIGAPSKNRVLALNTKMTYMGGRRTTPLDLQASIDAGESKYKLDEAFEHKLDDIFQMNLGITLRRNRDKTTHELTLDIQNVTNNLARIYSYYDAEEQSIAYSEQLGIIPNIIYRIKF